MIVNNRYKVFKKDLNYWNCFYSLSVYDKELDRHFTITHRCNYMFYSVKEILNKVFDIFVKLLKDEFSTVYERKKFITRHNIEFDYS